jgi:hypothetical protein
MCYGVRNNPWVIPFTAEDVGTRETALQERINAAKRLRARRWTLARIAAELDVCEDSVRQYLRAEPSPSRST